MSKPEQIDRLAGSHEATEEERSKELQEFLEKEVFVKLGISEEDEQAALAEVVPEKKEILERSFRNVRDTIRAYFEIEIIEGRFDCLSWKKDCEKLIAERVYSELFQELLSLGFKEEDLEKIGVTKTRIDLDWARTADILMKGRLTSEKEKNRFQREATLQIVREVEEAFERDGNYLGFKPEQKYLDCLERIKSKKYASEEQIELVGDFEEKLEEILTEKMQEWQRGVREKYDQIYQKLRVLKKKLEGDIDPDGIKLDMGLYYRKRGKEEVLTELLLEIERVRQSQFVTINVKPNSLTRIIDAGEILGIFSLEEKERISHAGEMGDGADFYLNHRRTTEEALGTYLEAGGTVYGCYGSENGHDEIHGCASVYGGVFIKLKPEVLTRSQFTEGDSLTSHGLVPSVARKLKQRNIDSIDYANFAQARQISLEHAPIAKAIFNLELNQEEKLRGHRDDYSYLETHIMGGVSLDDTESINVPYRLLEFERFASSYDYDRGSYVDILKELLSDPRIKDKVKILDEEGKETKL